MTKKEIQAQIDELHTRITELHQELKKCPEVEPFTCKGKWYLDNEGIANKSPMSLTLTRKSFNYWQTKEIAEKAYALQLRHRKMLSFVSQHQELDEGDYIIYYDIHSSKYYKWNVTNSKYPDAVMMTKETAELMLEAIENGSLVLEEK